MDNLWFKMTLYMYIYIYIIIYCIFYFYMGIMWLKQQKTFLFDMKSTLYVENSDSGLTSVIIIMYD